MSVYAISDVHGHKQELDQMLEKISFTHDDELWILGDIIDKGAESAELLRWAIEEAPDNIHFLLGNHEDIAYTMLSDIVKPPYVATDTLWIDNGGEFTLDQIVKMFDDDGKVAEKWIKDKVLPWIEKLPLYKHIKCGGREFMLVHGGFDPCMLESIPKEYRHFDVTCLVNMSSNARDEVIEVGHGFGTQSSQRMIWERKRWHTDPRALPIDVVFGHTHFHKERISDYAYDYGLEIRGGSGKIAHFGAGEKKHAIDCGCAYAPFHPRENMLGMFNLGCLRLDDMKEFYVPCRLDDHID